VVAAAERKGRPLVMTRWLITGAGGQLGVDLLRVLSGRDGV
jgi:hypothetical protein